MVFFSVVTVPPSASSRPPIALRLPPSNCHQQIVINHLSTTICHPRFVTNQLLPTNCHQPFVTNHLSSTTMSSTKYHQPISTNQLSPTNRQPIVINELSPTNYDLPSNCLLQGVGCTPWCWLALLGLRRCSAVSCTRGVQKHGVLQGFAGWKIHNLDSGEMQKPWVLQGWCR